MNLRPHPPPLPELNLTPLVDVVFLLLLFFMVSTTFEQPRELPLTLPEAEGQPVPTAETPVLVIAIDRNSQYRVAEQPLEIDAGQSTRDALTQVLQQAVQATMPASPSSPSSATPAPPLPSLLIEADAQTPHQAVMRVLDVAQQLGLTRLAFAATHQTHQMNSTPEP
ncbi:ExbD/TolR family protein [Rhabdochromatium marinum]|uniref:ExbD/TolR family protein n=1 Tax=Rhabdochromatium marinum TaxID=48729 RepID=UPI0019052F88|nr:biopolymer transporter ExbD [Rhabdochromatium marinum]MBK1648264.1 hypothetical protein [Rhabdochromatium marinum]